MICFFSQNSILKMYVFDTDYYEKFLELFQERKEGKCNPSVPATVGSGWSPLRNFGRNVPRKPRLIGGFEGHNAKESTLPGSPACGREIHKADHWREGNWWVVLKRVFKRYLRLGSSLKCAASSSPRGEASGFLRRDHPDSGCRISAHNWGSSGKQGKGEMRWVWDWL
jgi:hypothetical protein